MEHFLNFCSQKLILGTATFAGGYTAAILALLHCVPIVIGAIGAIAGGLAGIITFLIKWREIGGWKGIVEIVRNWKTGHE